MADCTDLKLLIMKNSLQVASFFVKFVFDRCVFSKHILLKKGYAKELRNARGYSELQRSCAIRLCYITSFHVGRDIICF